MKLWPTPIARDHKGKGGRGSDLPSVVSLWPTPTTFDAKDTMTCNPVITASGSIRHLNKQGGQSRAGLAIITKIGGNGQLNPAWVEWLMGFPIGWTELSA
jgi:NADH:ubiquinone oxidoreductase subunit F (NADH-binding)